MSTATAINAFRTSAILRAEEAELQRLYALDIPMTASRTGIRPQSNEVVRRLAIITQMRNLYIDLRAAKLRIDR